MFRKILISVVFCALLAPLAQAKRNYKFYYIAHSKVRDANADNADFENGQISNVLPLINYLKKIYNDAIEIGWDCVFYLANGDNPYIVRTSDAELDDSAFEQMIDAMQTLQQYPVNPEYDVDRLLDLFAETPFLDNDGTVNPEFDYIDINFFVTNKFWNDGYNESLLTKLLYSLDTDNLAKMKMYFWRWYKDGFGYDVQKPFGSKYSGSYNNDFQFYEYGLYF